jgi:hypothetical protein
MSFPIARVVLPGVDGRLRRRRRRHIEVGPHGFVLFLSPKRPSLQNQSCGTMLKREGLKFTRDRVALIMCSAIAMREDHARRIQMSFV